MKRRDMFPKGYTYYYVETVRLIGRTHGSVFTSEVYVPDCGWRPDTKCVIRGRLMGYEPDEEPGWRLFHADIMDEIREISREEARSLAERLSCFSDRICATMRKKRGEDALLFPLKRY